MNNRQVNELLYYLARTEPRPDSRPIISMLALMNAEALLTMLSASYIPGVSIYPTPEGGVHLEWHADDGAEYVEIAFLTTGRVEAFLGRDQDEDCILDTDISLPEARDFIHKWHPL